MQVTGKLIHVTDLRSGTNDQGKAWQNITIVLQTEEQYPKKIPIELNSISLIDKACSYELNQPLTVSINIDGREYNGKWYAKVIGWKI